MALTIHRLLDMLILTIQSLHKIYKTGIENSLKFVKIQGCIGSLLSKSNFASYFTLKDHIDESGDTLNRSSLTCYIPNYRLSEDLKRLLKDQGDSQHKNILIVSGRVKLFSNSFNPFIEVFKIDVEVNKTGSQQDKLLAEYTKILKEEGAFLPQNKPKLPQNIQRVGLISSRTSEGSLDFLETVKERANVKVLFYHTPMQGKDTPKAVAAAINYFNTEHPFKVDIIVLARGGGNEGDFEAFNNKVLVSAVRKSFLPVCSAVGHTGNVTLVDRVASLASYTPTKAALDLFPIPTLSKLKALKDNIETLKTTIKGIVFLMQCQLQKTNALLSTCSKTAFTPLFTKINYSLRELLMFKTIKLNDFTQEVTRATLILDVQNPERILKRGFCYITNIKGTLVTKGANLTTPFTIHFYKEKKTIT